MSLTLLGWSLCGAFGGALAGLGTAYPNDPGKYVLGGAIVGALVVGGGAAIATNEGVRGTIVCALVACEETKPDAAVTGSAPAFDIVLPGGQRMPIIG